MYFKKSILIASLLLFSLQLSAQKVVATVGKRTISVDEFKYLYDKNYGKSDDAYSEKSLREYLDMYIKFKLKVSEAYTQEYDKKKTFISEFKGFKKQLAKPYLTEKATTEKLLRASYERLNQEVKASHILIKVPLGANPDDTLKAYTKIAKLRAEILAGKDFEQAAFENSEDPSAKQNKGSLGYFTALQMVYEFEFAAYNTPIGEISQPFRTKFGYHLVKVYDKRKARGKLKVAHIMIRATEGMDKQDSVNAFKKASEIYNKLRSGEEWNRLCKQFSDDAGSKEKNGELEWFSVGHMYETFANTAFGIQKIGDVAAPIKTPFGWHIIKLIDKKELESYESMKDDLKSKIKSDSRSEVTRQAFLKRIRAENKFKEYPKIKTLALNSLDTTLLDGKWKADKSKIYSTKPLFKIKKRSYFISDFQKYVTANQSKRKGLNVATYTKILYKKFKEKALVLFETNQLTTKYPNYKFLLNEYREGLLLFAIMEDTIWNKAVADTTGLRLFFEKNQKDYHWKERAKAAIFNTSNKAILEQLKVDLQHGWNSKKKKGLETKYNKDNALTLSIAEKTFERGENPALDSMKVWSRGNFVVEQDKRVYYILIDEVFPAAPKKLKEIKGLVVSKYQTELENVWLAQLKVKYPIVINEKQLLKLVKKSK